MVAAVLKPRQTKQLPASRRAWRRRLLDWFGREGWDHPWRRTHDPYAILVSELMLQQTRLATVLQRRHYQRFLESFPDPARLAAADDASLLKAWEGLGYYRRARLLREAARMVEEQHGGRFPQDLEGLLKLPGVGRYTAGALLAFAFGKAAVLVDGNVSRILARVMDQDLEMDSREGMEWAWEMAGQLACDRRPREYHAALMELGQRYCTPRNPDCLHCPVAEFCATRSPHELPRKRSRRPATEVEEHALWQRDATGRLLMQRETGSRRTGLWRLPLRDAAEVSGLPLATELRYAITRYRVRLRVHLADTVGPGLRLREGETWVAIEALGELAMPSPFRKVVERLLDAT